MNQLTLSSRKRLNIKERKKEETERNDELKINTRRLYDMSHNPNTMVFFTRSLKKLGLVWCSCLQLK